MQFANDADEDDYQIVMIAKVADNEGKLIACDDGLYKIDGLDIKENETFAFENINVSMILWKRSDSDEDFQPLWYFDRTIFSSSPIINIFTVDVAHRRHTNNSVQC